jgi:hypothetical protein
VKLIGDFWNNIDELKVVDVVELSCVSGGVDKPTMASIGISFSQERSLLLKNSIDEEVTEEVRRPILRGFQQAMLSKIQSDSHIAV